MTAVRFRPGTLCLWLFLAAPLVLFFLSASRGLEETDEAHYVLTALDPWKTGGRGLFFGFGLHPLWLWGGESIRGFRWIGFAGTVLAALPLAFALRHALARSGLPAGLQTAVLPSVLLSALVIFSDGIRTPSYNWLVFTGSLWLVGSAWLAALFPRRAAGWGFSAGFGLLVLTLGKWPVTLGYVLFLWSASWWLGRLSGGKASALRFAVGWIASFLVLGGIMAYWISPAGWDRTWWTGQAQWEFGSHTSLVSWYAGNLLGFGWRYLRTLLWVAGAALLLWIGMWAGTKKRASPRQLATPLFWVAGLLSLSQGFGVGGAENFRKESLFALVWLTGVAVVSLRPANPPPAAGGSRFWLMWLLVFPWLNGLGSGTHLVDYVGHGVAFLTAGGWLLLASGVVRGLSAGTAWAAILVLALVQSSRAVTSLEHQFRLGSIRKQNTAVVSGPEAGRLFLDSARVGHLQTIERSLRESGFRPGDPVVGISDLCGLVYLVGGRSPGVPFFFGYDEEHCLPYAQKVLAAISPEERQSAWVIFREGTQVPRRPDLLWPKGSMPPQPLPMPEALAWPWGDGGGSPEKLTIYRPAAWKTR